LLTNLQQYPHPQEEAHAILNQQNQVSIKWLEKYSLMHTFFFVFRLKSHIQNDINGPLQLVNSIIQWKVIAV
jgi:hypothetical protein